MTKSEKYFMARAIELAQESMDSNLGGPFGVVIVKNGEIIAEGSNVVTSTNDPTAHAEINAIRKACKKLGAFQLTGCTIYTSCEPCPMCLGAIYWARPKNVIYACTRDDAKDIGFDDLFIYEELVKSNDNRKLPISSMMRKEALSVFIQWKNKSDKISY